MRSLFVLLAALAALQEWFVDANADCATATGGPAAPFCTIAEAIQAAADGDAIHIAPGTYVENLTLDKDLELRGTEGEAVTIVDGNQAGSVVTVDAGTTAAIDGLTLRNGRAERGAGILVDSSPMAPLTTLTLSNSTVSGNTAFSLFTATGGGIAANANSDVTLLRSTLRNNEAYGTLDLIYGSVAFGGGISNAGDMSVVECTLDGNSVRAYFAYSGTTISNSGTLSLSSSLLTNSPACCGSTIDSFGPLALTNSTLAGNVTILGAGLEVLYAGGTAPATVDGCVFWDNGIVFGVGPRQIRDPANNVTVTSSLLEGGWTGAGANNLNTDPLFVDPANGDYSLQPTSPCIDTGGAGMSLSSKGLGGNPRLLDGDLNRTMIVDMGAFEFGNVHLAVSGNATPGGMLTFDFSGTPGLTTRLVIASAPGELVFFPGGTLFFDLGSPLFKFKAGTLPSTLNLSIPPTIPMGTFSVIQAFAIGPPLPNGRLPLNFSNAVELTIR